MRIALLAALLVQSVAYAADSAPIRQQSATGIKHSFLITGSTGTHWFDENTNVIWTAPEYSRDGYVLDNGNILLAEVNTVKEYAKGTHDVIWSYDLQEPNTEIGTTWRLDNGNTLVTELGPNPRLLEVAPDGKIAVDVKLQPDTDNFHMQTRMARKLPNGNYLAPHLFAFAVKEYTPAGEVVRTIRTDLPEFGGREARNWPFTAILLENGNVLVNMTYGNKTAEFAPDGTVAWKADETDVPGNFSDACGGQRLPNGNTVIAAYGQKDGAKPKMFEITRDKKVVWQFYHPDLKVHELQILTTNGEKVTPAHR